MSAPFEKMEEKLEALIRENERLKTLMDERTRELTEIVRDEIEYKIRIKSLYQRNEELMNENKFLRNLVSESPLLTPTMEE
tara:strand:+ start:8033 stop:8275 length:243 start_codon:yes stop_codon:yes gene_type:complete